MGEIADDHASDYYWEFGNVLHHIGNSDYDNHDEFTPRDGGLAAKIMDLPKKEYRYQCKFCDALIRFENRQPHDRYGLHRCLTKPAQSREGK